MLLIKDLIKSSLDFEILQDFNVFCKTFSETHFINQLISK